MGERRDVPGISFKREGTGLVLGPLPDQVETRTDLAAQFELTAREDLGAGRCRRRPGRMTVRVTAAAATQEAIITWSRR